jgi:hypothetical protein
MKDEYMTVKTILKKLYMMRDMASLTGQQGLSGHCGSSPAKIYS